MKFAILFIFNSWFRHITEASNAYKANQSSKLRGSSSSASSTGPGANPASHLEPSTSSKNPEIHDSVPAASAAAAATATAASSSSGSSSAGGAGEKPGSSADPSAGSSSSGRATGSGAQSESQPGDGNDNSQGAAEDAEHSTRRRRGEYFPRFFDLQEWKASIYAN